MSVVWLAQSELDAYIGWLLCYPGRCQWTSVSVEVIAMADVMKGSDPDDGIETTDLSAAGDTTPDSNRPACISRVLTLHREPIVRAADPAWVARFAPV
jgi:hypothetical protein